MRAAITALAAGAILVGGWAAVADDPPRDPRPADKKAAPKPDRKKVRELMAQKTEHSQKVLDALMKNDMAAAAKHAEELLRIRKEAAWFVVKTDVYNLWSDQFTESAQKIVKAAKEKNYEVAKLGYLEMTLNCFHCHAYVRDLGLKDIGHRPDPWQP
jgi:hypothetical protein